MENKPKALCFAGPNGSGKSTITRNREIIGFYVNADEPTVIFAKNNSEQVIRENQYWDREKIEKLVRGELERV